MERFNESLYVALANLRANPLRSFLSILGIVVGIAAVITVLAFGAASRREILQRVNAMGVNVHTVYAHYNEKNRRMGHLELDDVKRLQAVPFVVSAFPGLSLFKEMRSRNVNVRGSIRGVDSRFLKAQQYPLIKGRDFSPIEFDQRSTVCLISESTSRTLFPNGEPLGNVIYVEDTPWTVIGIYRVPGRTPGVSSRLGDAEILTPLTTLLRSAKDLTINTIEVHVKPDETANVNQELIQVMERGDPNRQGLFLVRDQREMVEKRLQIKRNLSLIGVLVAAISLIVGGIGMMNVMLTSVAERTREIGIRRAVGARRRDILFQFLIESSLLSSLGGILGLVVGATLARSMPLFFREAITAAPEIQPNFLLIAVGSGILLGVTFGLYPAVKASHLSPAEALRTE